MHRRANAPAKIDEPADDEHADGADGPSRPAERPVRRLGRVRVPLTLTCRPWATAWQLPDGRIVWCLRLWRGERPERSCVPTHRLLAYCASSGLVEAAAEIRRIAGR